MELKVLTINARGLRDAGKRKAFLFSLATVNFGVAFLQECHLKDNGDIKTFSKEWKEGPSCWSIGHVHADGVGILFKGRGFVIESSCSVNPGRVLCVDVNWSGARFRCINVYAPSKRGARLEFFKCLPSLLNTSRVVVMGGDFNVSLDKLERGDQGARDFSAMWVKKMCTDFSLYDTYREINKQDGGFTWRNSRGDQSRIDYFFLPAGVKIQDFKIFPCWGSDHEMAVVSIKVEVPERGTGFWKLNIRVLEDEAFQARFQGMYKGWQNLKRGYDSLVGWWEDVKKKVTMFCQEYCRWQRRRERDKIRGYNYKLQGLLSKMNNGEEIDWGEVKRLKGALGDYFEQKAQEFAFLAKINEKENDEKVTKFFFQSVKQKQTKSVVIGLKTEKGVVGGKEEMLMHARRFYRDLFAEREVSQQEVEVLLNNIENKLTSEEQDQLEGEVTEEEAKVALDSMKGNKTPGCDGLPKEFFLCFWGLIKKDLVEVYREIFKGGIMPESMRKGVISLIFKKGDKTELENWRPITLLSVDYKILSKILTNRLKGVMPSIVNIDQTCGVKGRSSCLNLILIRDILSWVKERDLPLCLLNLDQEKAFDRVNHAFLLNVLKKFNFGPVFLKWIQILYREVFSCVNINGFFSEPVKQSGGVRQGCPLSPLLYVIFIEPLAELVRKDKDIKGVHIPGGAGDTVKVTQYADDMTLFLSTDKGLDRIVELLQGFSRATGSKINMGKSSIMYCGRWADRNDVRHGFTWCKDGMKILGLNFYKEECAKRNWVGKIERVKTQLDIWRARRLTIKGKVVVIKADLLPGLNYMAYIFPMPTSCKLLLTKLVFSFIWGGRYGSVKREQMYMPVPQGGRDVPCIPLKLEVLYVHNICKMIIEEKDHKACFFVKFWFSFVLRSMVNIRNVVPKAEKRPWHYERAALFLKAHPEILKKEVLLNHKGMYTCLRDKMINKRAGVQVNSEINWKQLQPKYLDNSTKDLNWLAAVNRLPVKDNLYRHGCARDSLCPRECGTGETVGHALWSCRVVTKFWRRVRMGIMKGVIGDNVLSSDCILYGGGLNILKQREYEVVWTIVSMGKEWVWNTRCKQIRKIKDVLTVKEMYYAFVAQIKGMIKMYGFVHGEKKCKETWGLVMINVM